MTAKDTGQHVPSGRHPRPAGKVDFTFMYAANDAFNRDLRRLAAAVEAGRTADPAVRTGWATFKNQPHIHYTAEDVWLWPALRDKVTRPGEASVLDAMEAEHAPIDPLVSRVDASLAAAGLPGLAENASALTRALAAHMEHEEDHALPSSRHTWAPAAGPRSGRPPGRARAGRAPPSSSPGCSTAPRPTPASGYSACCRHQPGSSTRRCCVPAMPAPHAGARRQSEPPGRRIR